MASTQKSTTLEPIDLLPFLKRFRKALKQTWLLVLILVLLFSGMSYIRQRRSFTPMYSCDAIFSVGSSYSSEDIFSNNLNYDTVTAQQIAKTFPYLLTTDYMRDMILAQLESGYINGRISAAAISSTNMVTLTVTSSDPQDAYDILNAVIQCYPTAAVYMVDSPVLYIRETPVVPTEPINSFSPFSAIAKGALIGLCLGLVLTAGVMLLIQSVASADELKKIVSLPILATFPRVNTRKRSGNGLITSNVDPGFAEVLRSLRTRAKKILEEKHGQVLLLTSTVPGEGKTTVSVNLALSLAAEGHRVVLVDADLRKQSIGKLLQSQEKHPGLMDLLTNPSVSIDDCLQSSSDTNFAFISGVSTQKQHYNLDMRQLRRVLGVLSARFDYVVVDTSPCSVISDAALISRYADSVLYVVRSDFASRIQIQDAISSLYQKDAPLAGCILNSAQIRQSRYGYGYGYGYGRKKHNT